MNLIGPLQSNHPLKFSTVPDGTHNGGVELLENIQLIKIIIKQLLK